MAITGSDLLDAALFANLARNTVQYATRSSGVPHAVQGGGATFQQALDALRGGSDAGRTDVSKESTPEGYGTMTAQQRDAISGINRFAGLLETVTPMAFASVPTKTVLGLDTIFSFMGVPQFEADPMFGTPTPAAIQTARDLFGAFQANLMEAAVADRVANIASLDATRASLDSAQRGDPVGDPSLSADPNDPGGRGRGAAGDNDVGNTTDSPAGDSTSSNSNAGDSSTGTGM